MSSIILKIQNASRQDHKLNKLIGTVALAGLIDLFSIIDLEANPRLSKVGSVTADIEESMEREAELFHFMSKGLLIASSEVEELDRNRYRLTFGDTDLEGILDGGHNSLAAARWILRSVLTAAHGEESAEKTLKKVKTWKQMREAWDANIELIQEHKASIPEILMPVEVIFPAKGAHEYFQDKVLIINAARNNNAELTMETRDNKLGYYTEIMTNLDPELRDQVEWKTNDGGRIKVRDLVALALVPLSNLDYPVLEGVRRSPAVIFSSKGQCVQIYNRLMSEPGVTEETKGNIVQIVDPGVRSALAMMEQLPRLFDLIYARLPAAYNQAGGKFGKIEGVAKSNGKVMRSRYYRTPVEYSYGEGYLFPIFFGLSNLMKIEDGELVWATNPEVFIKNNLNGIMRTFNAMISGQNYDPAKVGKTTGNYHLAANLVAAALKDEILKEKGIL